MIIGISGKKQHGKDTIKNIIQYLVTEKYNPNYFDRLKVEDYIKDNSHLSPSIISGWETRKFADKLKDMVCMLIGCTREQLEDNDFKEKPLGEDWDCMVYMGKGIGGYKYAPVLTHDEWRNNLGLLEQSYYVHRRLTPRLMLQLLGTDCGRNIIHPDVWVNATLVDYQEDIGYKYQVKKLDDNDDGSVNMQLVSDPVHFNNGYPNWIIPDVRFPNEVKAIKKRGGVVIRVDRPMIESNDNHYSETALDGFNGFDAHITNNGSLDVLIDQVKIYLRYINIL